MSRESAKALAWPSHAGWRENLVREIYAVELSEEEHVGAARRSVHLFAQRCGFSAQALAEIDLAVQEIGTNAVRYAQGSGALHYSIPLAGEAGLELCYWDQGPGIYDLSRALNDGVSVGGSLGGGLGAINRQMDEFEIYSMTRSIDARPSSRQQSTHGTMMLCRKWVAGAPPRHAATRYTSGAWSRPYPGEQANGDAYLIRTVAAGQTLLAVVDGLGHGSGAKQAADVARESINEWSGEPIDEVLMSVHQALRATRGAVAAMIIIEPDQRRLSYAGVGNIDARLFELNTPSVTRFVPVNGTLGLRTFKARVGTYEWRAEDVLLIVMASDGINSQWDMQAYPDLVGRDPQLIAGMLMRDYSRASDDATVLVVRVS